MCNAFLGERNKSNRRLFCFCKQTDKVEQSENAHRHAYCVHRRVVVLYKTLCVYEMV